MYPAKYISFKPIKFLKYTLNIIKQNYYAALFPIFEWHDKSLILGVTFQKGSHRFLGRLQYKKLSWLTRKNDKQILILLLLSYIVTKFYCYWFYCSKYSLNINMSNLKLNYENSINIIGIFYYIIMLCYFVVIQRIWNKIFLKHISLYPLKTLNFIKFHILI